MRPDAAEELKFQVAEEEGESIENALERNFNRYEGLTVAITDYRYHPNFLLC